MLMAPWRPKPATFAPTFWFSKPAPRVSVGLTGRPRTEEAKRPSDSPYRGRTTDATPSPSPAPPIAFFVNPSDELPIYRQIVRQVIDAIAGGKLRPDDQLPSHRELSQALVIAPLTVKKAYDELEKDGYIETSRGQGTFVSARAPQIESEDKLTRLEPAVQRLVSEASLLGVGDDELVNLVRDAARSLREAHPAKDRGRKR